MTAPGWYQADGDPAGTTRYWDGAQWIGDPVHTPAGPSAADGFRPYQSGPSAGLKLASPGARLGGRIIDVIILSIIALVLFFPVIGDVISDIDALGPSPTNAQVERIATDAIEDNFALLAVLGIGSILWDFLWVAIFGGTPGKLILGMRVARSDNGATPPGFGKAALRSLNRIVALIPGIGSLIVGLVGLISLIMLFADNQHRTVMDRIASTVVIKK